MIKHRIKTHKLTILVVMLLLALSIVYVEFRLGFIGRLSNLEQLDLEGRLSNLEQHDFEGMLSEMEQLERLLRIDIASTFYTLQKPASYIISQLKSGAKTYNCMQNGTTGKLVWYSTDADEIFNACNSNLTSIGGKIVVRFGAYQVDALITIRENVTMEFEAGSLVEPTSDVDMFLVEPNSQLIGLSVDTTGITFNKAVIKFEGNKYNEYTAERTIVRDVQGFGGSTGTFILLNASNFDGTKSSIAFVMVDGVTTRGFEYVIRLKCSPTPEHTTFVNSNFFKNIRGYNAKYFVYHDDEPSSSDSIDSNHFLSVSFQAGSSTEKGFYVVGRGNHVNADLWEWGDAQEGATAIECSNTSSYNTFECFTNKRYVKDRGHCNTIIYRGSLYANDYVEWKDDFLGDSLSNLWNVSGGSAAIYYNPGYGYNGEARLTTGASAGDTTEINWGNNCHINPDKCPEMFVHGRTKRTSNYTWEFGFKYQDDNNRIYIKLSTNLLLGGQVGCVDGGSTTSKNFIWSHTMGRIGFIIKVYDGGVSFFWISPGGEQTIIGSIHTDIPTADLQPYLRCQTHIDSTLYVDVDIVHLKWVRY